MNVTAFVCVSFECDRQTYQRDGDFEDGHQLWRSPGMDIFTSMVTHPLTFLTKISDNHCQISRLHKRVPWRYVVLERQDSGSGAWAAKH